jgi:hypothetical protein
MTQETEMPSETPTGLDLQTLLQGLQTPEERYDAAEAEWIKSYISSLPDDIETITAGLNTLHAWLERGTRRKQLFAIGMRQDYYSPLETSDHQFRQEECKISQDEDEARRDRLQMHKDKYAKLYSESDSWLQRMLDNSFEYVLTTQHGIRSFGRLQFFALIEPQDRTDSDRSTANSSSVLTGHEPDTCYPQRSDGQPIKRETSRQVLGPYDATSDFAVWDSATKCFAQPSDDRSTYTKTAERSLTAWVEDATDDEGIVQIRKSAGAADHSGRPASTHTGTQREKLVTDPAHKAGTSPNLVPTPGSSISDYEFDQQSPLNSHEGSPSLPTQRRHRTYVPSTTDDAKYTGAKRRSSIDSNRDRLLPSDDDEPADGVTRTEIFTQNGYQFLRSMDDGTMLPIGPIAL